MASTVLLVVVFILDLAAFVLAVVAEQRRSTAQIVTDTQNRNRNYCSYESDIATGLGVGALLSLMASQILIMIASKCFCCGKALKPGRSRPWAIILFISCWLTFCVAEVCLLAASVRNAYHTKYISFADDSPSCRTLRKGVFSAGAAFIVFTGIFTELYYVLYSSATEGPPLIYERDAGVRMQTL